jgi:hypothetical protein
MLPELLYLDREPTPKNQKAKKRKMLRVLRALSTRFVISFSIYLF